MSEVCFHAVGRRKKAIARVRLIPGEGNITINKRSIDDYFGYETLKMQVRQPLTLTDTTGRFDVIVNVKGGGYTGQAEALRLAIARALVKINPEDKSVLRKHGFMTRDPRAVERKKPGQPKARKRFQFSKR